MTQENDVDAPVAVISGRTAAWLNDHGLDRLRVNVRGLDARRDADLNEVRVAGEKWKVRRQRRESDSPLGFPKATNSGLFSHSTSELCTVADVAVQLGISVQAVRKAIRTHRLDAVKRGGIWLISGAEVRRFAAVRRGGVTKEPWE